MKKILFTMTTLIMMALCVASCGDDDNDGVVPFQEQTATAWGKVTFKYSATPMYDANETITVNEKVATFHSDTWGDGTFNVTSLTRNSDGSWTVKGEGTMTIAGHGGKKDYEATFTAKVAGSASTVTISIPTVMGGTTIEVKVGDIPPAAAVDGSYTGGTYANAKYFSKYQPTKDEKVTLLANEALDGVSASYTSETWGAFSFATVTVTKDGEGYKISAEGTTLMPGMNGGEAKTYEATLEGTVKDGELVATFSIPGVMGGTTVYFNAEDFEEVYNAAQNK